MISKSFLLFIFYNEVGIIKAWAVPLTGRPVVAMFEATSYAAIVMSHMKQAVYMELAN